MQDGKKSNKVKKGSLAIQVGLEESEEGLQKFVIPIWYLYHPKLIGLLDQARETYGYQVDGPLRLPCSVDDFIHLRWQIEREHSGGGRPHGGGSTGGRHHHNLVHHYLNYATSSRSC